MPKISAIICTHNREKYLGAAIDSLLAQDFPDYEIIVVDNASSDRTREIVQARPSVKYIYESVTGLSVARNTGAQSATSQILAYLDDDAVASPHWLSVLYTAYQSNEKLAIAGGKVTLIWPEGILPPAWLSDDLAGNLGAYDLGDKIVYIDRPGLTPRGLNYSIRRKFLAEIGGFDINLGRVGKKLLSNEELLMTEQALNRGWQVAYLPEALVQHNVSPERINPQWFFSRGWWQGISEYYREQLVGKAGVKQLGRGGERLMYGVYKTMKYFRYPDRRFENLVYSYGQIGYLMSVIMGLFSATKREK
ncbi:glycosyltransferase family 2 protein [Aerosakkonemataceae cyanobacterium BLCC-F154]|uniref:Glycosyltransferase family 2 protein n=1 Tax=Floridaenema fluviatile BLCC-F154 TaxID=3153640 RepID=A0ABV4YJ63_9CYAN